MSVSYSDSLGLVTADAAIDSGPAPKQPSSPGFDCADHDTIEWPGRNIV
jgi:hypothetical protein